MTKMRTRQRNVDFVILSLHSNDFRAEGRTKPPSSSQTIQRIHKSSPLSVFLSAAFSLLFSSLYQSSFFSSSLCSAFEEETNRFSEWCHNTRYPGYPDSPTKAPQSTSPHRPTVCIGVSGIRPKHLTSHATLRIGIS
jgi:hypothetical protein